MATSIDATPCPGCGVKALRIEVRLKAKPIGSFSLAGVQMKVSHRGPVAGVRFLRHRSGGAPMNLDAQIAHAVADLAAAEQAVAARRAVLTELQTRQLIANEPAVGTARNGRRGTHHGSILGFRIHLEGNDDVDPTPPCAWCSSAVQGARRHNYQPCPCGGWRWRDDTRCADCQAPGSRYRRLLERPIRWVRRRGILVAG